MKIGIFGTSGFSREVADICLEMGYKDIVFISETNSEDYFDFPVITEEKVNKLVKKGFHFIIGIGSNQIRRKIYLKYKDSLKFVNVIHPSATFGRNQYEQLEKRIGNIVAAGVRMTNNIRLGNFGVYNLNCTVGHDCIIEDFVTISPGANISGNVKLSEGCYIGTNASILQGKSVDEKLVVGKESVVGAGAVVTKDVPDKAVVKGVPAK